MHRDFEEIGIGCVGVVHIDFFLRLPDEVPELVCEELLASFDVGRFAVVVGEDFVYGAHAAGDLFSEEIDFVQEENQGGFFKVFTVRYRLEEHEGLVHLVLGVVLACADVSDQRCDLLHSGLPPRHGRNH